MRAYYGIHKNFVSKAFEGLVSCLKGKFFLGVHELGGKLPASHARRNQKTSGSASKRNGKKSRGALTELESPLQHLNCVLELNSNHAATHNNRLLLLNYHPGIFPVFVRNGISLDRFNISSANIAQESH